MTYQRRGAMIAQPACMNRRRDKLVPQRVHHQERCASATSPKSYSRGPWVRVGQDVGSTAISLRFFLRR
jgi:hypothetical protein